MPFQSEKQRKYLWANEPAIAREWTDKYGSRVKKDNGRYYGFGFGSPWYQSYEVKVVKEDQVNIQALY